MSVSETNLNLLRALAALLREESVAGAARRMERSPSAMSRALARLREATGDPLLVRAGRGMVPTPRALELQERVPALLGEVEAVLGPSEELDLAHLERTFTLRSREGFVENFGAALLDRVAREAPGVRLRFEQKTGNDSAPLRDGSVDLETGVVKETTGPEVRARTLFRDRFVGVVRDGHALAEGEVTPERFAASRHVRVSLVGPGRGLVDEALATLGLAREITAIVGGFAAALALARETDLIASVPERHTGTLRQGLHTFPLPFPPPEVTVSLLWHPRLHTDPAHRWLRRCVFEVCSAT